MGKISVGVAGAIGVLVGILLAPRKGSETREKIVRRSEPLQQAARKAASRAGDTIKPVTRMVGKRVPFLDRDNKELGFPRPAPGEMQSEAARRAGDPSHQSEDPPPEGLGGYGPFAQTNPRRPAGEVMRHHLASIGLQFQGLPIAVGDEAVIAVSGEAGNRASASPAGQ